MCLIQTVLLLVVKWKYKVHAMLPKAINCTLQYRNPISKLLVSVNLFCYYHSSCKVKMRCVVILLESTASVNFYMGACTCTK